MPSPELVAVIARAREAFEPDSRVFAMWIEGAIARGTDDGASDLDLHLAIADDAFEDFGEPAEVLATIAGPLGYLVIPLPGYGLLPAALAGPVRVDLCLESRARLAVAPRMPAGQMIFDRDHVEADLAKAPSYMFDAREQLAILLRTLWFGSTWPARFTLREDWGGLLMNATGVVHQFIVPALLIADGSPEFHREPYARSRFLSAERRVTIDSLLAHALEAFSGLGGPDPDLDRLASFHERFLATLWGSLREACAAAGVEYPVATAREYRDYYARTLGLSFPDWS